MVSRRNKTGGVLYYMWMLPSKVMPYLLRLAAPLMDSSIVHRNITAFVTLGETVGCIFGATNCIMRRLRELERRGQEKQKLDPNQMAGQAAHHWNNPLSCNIYNFKKFLI